MKNILQFVRTTLMGGTLFLAPIVVLVIILGKALAIAHKLVDPLAARLPIESVVGLRTPLVLAVVLLVFFCFLAGVLARTALAQKSVARLEAAVLSNLPGYEFLKRMGESLLGVEKSGAYPVVLARFDDTAQLGFEVERLENGRVVVFIPGAPLANSGEVHWLSPDRVSPLNVPPAAALKSLKRLGAGSNTLFPADSCHPKPDHCTPLKIVHKQLLLHAALVSAVAATTVPCRAAEVADPLANWRESYAYTLGVQAYVFGFPYVYLPTLRWSWVTVPKPAGGTLPYAPLNHFHHVRNVADASYRDGGCPNNDTLYSIAWVDVSKEPVVLSHPDMGDRYFTFELACMDSDNFAYVGKRTTGGKAGSYALVGPNWKGKLPKGVKPLAASRTPTVLIFGRTLVDGPADVPVVNKLQDQYTLIPLSFWGKKDAQLPASREVWPPFNPKTDPLAEWKTMNRAMTENPPEARLDKLVGLFAQIGVGPGQDVHKMDEATKRGLVRAAADGRKLLKSAIDSGELGKRVNSWNIPPRVFGRAGLNDDFLLRGSVQCLGGIIANEPEEAVYYNTTLDGSGEPFDGSKGYVMHFAPGQLPKVNGFWSITLYDPTYNLTANPINRYSIGDRTPGLKKDADGGLTIYIQGSSPGQDKESNWLPSTTSGPFSMVMRTYMPGSDIVEQKWAPPPVVVVTGN